jgi:gluconokinase
MLVVVMGVSGAGKTTVGRLLAERLGATFLDGDDFHPPASVAKMRAGVPLDDHDRAPWLGRLHEELAARAALGQSVVLACSALKEGYRCTLAAGLTVRFVHLTADRTVLATRLAGRSDHYMPATLLESQLAALEAPTDAIMVDVNEAPAAIVDRLDAALRGAPR